MSPIHAKTKEKEKNKNKHNKNMSLIACASNKLGEYPHKVLWKHDNLHRIPSHLKSLKDKASRGMVIKASFLPKILMNSSSRNSMKMAC